LRRLRATKNRSRACALGAVFSPPHFGSPASAKAWFGMLFYAFALAYSGCQNVSYFER